MADWRAGEAINPTLPSEAQEHLRQAELEALLEAVLAAGEGLQGKAMFDAMYEEAQATIDRTYPGTNATLRFLAAQHLTSLALVRVEPVEEMDSRLDHRG